MFEKRKCLFGWLAAVALVAVVAPLHGAVIVTMTPDHAPAGGSGAYTPSFVLPSNNLVAGQIAQGNCM